LNNGNSVLYSNKKNFSLLVKTILFIILFCFISPKKTIALSKKELHQFNKIKYYSKIKNYKRLKYYSNKFFQKYPKSKFIPDIKYLIAKSYRNPKIVIKKLESIIKNYKYYKKNPKIQLELIEIYKLFSKWNMVIRKSKDGIWKYKKSRYRAQYMLNLTRAYIEQNKLQEAKKLISIMLKKFHNYEILANTLLLKTFINLKTNGYGRGYIYTTRELARGFKNSKIYPSTLMMLGNFYFENQDWNRSYSAYYDLMKKFSNSPEAKKITQRLIRLKKHNPKKMAYIPEEKLIKKTDIIKIKPEIKIETNKELKIYFSLSVGPIKENRLFKSIHKIIKKFSKTFIAKTKKGYTIYCGHFKKLQDAINLKIRLAEEEGINAKVVKIKNGKQRQFIYGE